MHDLVNYSEIINRIKDNEGLRFEKEVAGLLNLSESDFNNRKRRGTLLCLLISYGIKKEISLDWLLIGIQPKTNPQSEEEFMAQWPEEIQNACRLLKDILLSDHPVIKPALLSNLAAFQHSVSKEKSQEEEVRKQKEGVRKLKEEIRKLRKENRLTSKRLLFLEDRHKAESPTGTDGAASSSTGKPET